MEECQRFLSLCSIVAMCFVSTIVDSLRVPLSAVRHLIDFGQVTGSSVGGSSGKVSCQAMQDCPYWCCLTLVSHLVIISQ
jgi:hypothetical protein